YPLDPFTGEDAGKVLDMLHSFQKEAYEKYGTHFVHASDEWYILAGQPLPPGESYDGYLQLENGVGMLRLLLDEFQDALKGLKERLEKEPGHLQGILERSGKEISLATGVLAFPYIREIAREMADLLPGMIIHVYEIKNCFFGEMITVAGLLTGRDIMAQLKGKPLGQRLLLPQNILRSGGDVFLDDVTVGEMEKALQVKIDIVKSSGYDFVDALLGENI
ncbi:MAG: DUF512 domain-containing protein, partial [Lachnospiraceae bacterium]|nr:DUF512 domain-containing protein [Lachnospiraceae bacterium]